MTTHDSMERGRGRRLRSRWLLATGLATLAALASSLSPAAQAATPRRGGALTYLFSFAAPTSFDPAQSAAPTGPGNYLSAVFGSLVYEDWDRSGKVIPSMAQSLAATGDPSHWVLKLRAGVKFSDGTPFDAAAVQYNWDRVKTVTTSTSRATALTIGSMSVTNPQTLAITLTSPNAGFDRAVAANLAYVGSPKAMKADLSAFFRRPIGAGPFRLTSYSSLGTAHYVRNGGYWDQPRPYLDELTIKFIADDQQRVNTMIAGGAQMANPGSGPQARKSGTDAGFKLVSAAAPGGGGTFIFNTARRPFSDRNARLAVQYALDRDGMNEAVTGGTGRVIPTMFAKNSPYYNAKAVVPARNPAKAQELFDAYADKFGKMTINLTSAQGAASLAEIIQAQLRGYKNVDVKVRLVDNATFTPSLQSGAFDLATFTWTASHPGASFQQFYARNGGFNFGKYNNSEVDRLLVKAAAAPNPQVEAQTYQRIEEIVMNQDAVAYFEWLPTRLVLRSTKVQDLDYAQDGVFLWDRIWLTR